MRELNTSEIKSVAGAGPIVIENAPSAGPIVIEN